MATPTRRAATAPQYVNFGSLSNYSSGGSFDLPEGDYRWASLDIVMFTPEKRDGTVSSPAYLAVALVLEPPNGAATEDDKHRVICSMGRNAHLTFAPDPATGKRLVLVPGGPPAQLNESTNWGLLLKSLYDTGMPEDYFTDDITVLESIITHMANVPEPESRQELRKQSTSEIPSGQPARVRKIPVVTEVLSAPWLENAPVKTAAKPALARPAQVVAPAKVAPKANGAPAPAPVQASSNEQAASEAIAEFLSTHPDGASKKALRIACFRALASNPNKPTIMADYFDNPDNFGALLGQMAYTIDSGENITPA